MPISYTSAENQHEADIPWFYSWGSHPKVYPPKAASGYLCPGKSEKPYNSNLRYPLHVGVDIGIDIDYFEKSQTYRKVARILQRILYYIFPEPFENKLPKWCLIFPKYFSVHFP